MAFKLSKANPYVKKLLALTFPNYKGRTIKAELIDKVHIYDLNWSGGTKNEYKFVNGDFDTASLPRLAPWDNYLEGQVFQMLPDSIVAVHKHFCGQDLGITFYLHPVHTPKFITDGDLGINKE